MWLCLSRGCFRLGGRGRPLRGRPVKLRPEWPEGASHMQILAQCSSPGEQVQSSKVRARLDTCGEQKKRPLGFRVQRGRGASSPGWGWRFREETGKSLILKHFADHWVTSLGPAFRHFWSPAQHPPLSVLWTSEPSVARGQVRPLRDIGLILMWSCGPWADWILRQFKCSILDYLSIWGKIVLVLCSHL